MLGYSSFGIGHTCSTNDDECASSPCQNGATCVDAVYAYTCDCANGWDDHPTQLLLNQAQRCDTHINTCGMAEDDCDDHAQCTHVGPGQHTCTCRTGWSGDGHTCMDVNECLSNPCQNGATCTESSISVNRSTGGSVGPNGVSDVMGLGMPSGSPEDTPDPEDR